jgi:hypothetical protein
MKITYVPLLAELREIYELPRGRDRFRQYLRTIVNDAGDDVDAVPLLISNPMGKEHVVAHLDAALALDADGLAAQACAAATDELAELPGDFRAALTVADDLKGGWTNRYADEFTMRCPVPGAKRFWITGVLWSSEAPTADLIRQTMLAAVYRSAYALRYGPARTLRDLLAQEGYATARAGCTTPALDPEDIEYTRQVIAPFLDVTDMRTCVECLFGDVTAESLGFSRRGLSPWAGLALALHDAWIVTVEKGGRCREN